MGSFEGDNHAGGHVGCQCVRAGHPERDPCQFNFWVVSGDLDNKFNKCCTWVWTDRGWDAVDDKPRHSVVGLHLCNVEGDFSQAVADVRVEMKGGRGVGIGGGLETMVFFEVAFANVKQNWPDRVSLMLRRILSSSVARGMDSTVVTMTSHWVGERVVSNRGTGFVFFCLVTVWKGVSAPCAAAVT